MCWSYLMPFMFICSVAYQYVYLYQYREGFTNIYSYWHHTFSDLSHCIQKFTGWVIIQAGKLKFFGTHPNWAVSYMPIQNPTFPGLFYTRPAIFSLALASRQALVSQPVIELSIRWQSAHFWSVGGRKRVLIIVMLIYRHDMRSGFQ